MSSASKRRVPLALYRQLLRWTTSVNVDPKPPLSAYVPALMLGSASHSVAADVDLSDERLLPSTAVWSADRKSVACPIHTIEDVRNLVRSLFKMNASAQSQDKIKDHISVGFDALKSMNALSPIVEGAAKEREQHTVRPEGLLYKVGEVVQHTSEEWRGVVIGWNEIEVDSDDSADDSPPTSLTSKKYTSPDIFQYSVLLDTGDAHLHYTKRREPGNMNVSKVHQSDLQPVQDKRLRRIRNSHTSEHFESFDVEAGRFVLNETNAYEYPADVEEGGEDSLAEIRTRVSNDLKDGVRQAASHLHQILVEAKSDSPVLLPIMEQLAVIIQDDDDDESVIPMGVRLSLTNITPAIVAMAYLQRWNSIVFELCELAFERRKALSNKDDEKPLDFKIGDVVQHKGYGFRGVIVGWDPKPVVDVSNWDGLQNLEDGVDPNQLPFYHVIPDQRDCLQAFGGERGSRYVCQLNLELCLPDRRKDMEVEVHALGSTWKRNELDGSYKPPANILYKYGEDLSDEGRTDELLLQLKNAVSHLYVAARDGTKANFSTDEDVAKLLSMTNLLQMLQVVESMGDAIVVSETIKEMWKAHDSDDLRQHLDEAIAQLLNGHTEKALMSFGSLLARDPLYAEAWNKASTCEFMLGRLDASRKSAEQVLDLNPHHFQALNGLGLVRHLSGDAIGAVECFRRGMDLDPWSPVSSRLTSAMKDVEEAAGSTKTTEEEDDTADDGNFNETNVR